MVIRKQRTTAQLSIVLTQFIFIFINVVQWNSYSFLNYLFLYQKQRIRTFFTRLGSDFSKVCLEMLSIFIQVRTEYYCRVRSESVTFWSRSSPKKKFQTQHFLVQIRPKKRTGSYRNTTKKSFKKFSMANERPWVGSGKRSSVAE